MIISSIRKATQFYIIATIAVLLAFIGISIYVISHYAEKGSFEHSKDSTVHTAEAVRSRIADSQKDLLLFTEFLVDKGFFADENMGRHLEEFCALENFTGLRLLRENGTVTAAGKLPMHAEKNLIFSQEAAKAPYIEEILSPGAKRSEQYIRLAAPIIENARTTGIIYGYLSLETLAPYAQSNESHKGQFFIIDCTTGNFLVDESHRFTADKQELPLGNLYLGINLLESESSTNWQKINQDLRKGNAGYAISLSAPDNQRNYIRYMPIGINNWFLLSKIEETEAFSYFYKIRQSLTLLAVLIIVSSLLMLGMLLLSNRREMQFESQRLKESEAVSRTDYLTGVGNRRAVYEYAKTLYSGQELGVIYCDVTELKHINDTLGHQGGDELLLKTVQGIRTVFELKQVFRMGGDEFMIICTDTTKDEMLAQLQRMQNYWQQHGINVACGYAWIEYYSGDPETLSTVAEQRMYKAKSDWYRTNGIDRRKR